MTEGTTIDQRHILKRGEVKIVSIFIQSSSISILDPWSGHDWKIHDRRYYNFARGQNCSDLRSWIFQLCPIQGSEIGIPIKYWGFFVCFHYNNFPEFFLTVYWSGKPNHDRSWLGFPDRLRKDHKFQHTDYTIILIGITNFHWSL